MKFEPCYLLTLMLYCHVAMLPCCHVVTDQVTLGGWECGINKAALDHFKVHTQIRNLEVPLTSFERSISNFSFHPSSFSLIDRLDRNPRRRRIEIDTTRETPSGMNERYTQNVSDVYRFWDSSSSSSSLDKLRHLQCTQRRIKACQYHPSGYIIHRRIAASPLWKRSSNLRYTSHNQSPVSRSD